MNLARLSDTPPWDWPRNAGETFKKVLRDRSSAPRDRIQAAALAGDLVVMDDEMADLLLSVVQNSAEPDQLRSRAAIALGPVLEETDMEGFDDDYSEPPIEETTFERICGGLREIYMDEGVAKEVRRRALEAAVRAPQNWQREAIQTAYSSPDEEWRLTAAFCMRWVRGFDEQILELLKSPNPDIEFEAVCAAGNWEVDEAWPHVRKLIASEKTDKPLLLAAIEAAGAIWPPEARGILADLSDSEDEEIAEAAMEALTNANMAEAF